MEDLAEEVKAGRALGESSHIIIGFKLLVKEKLEHSQECTLAFNKAQC